MPVSGLVTRGRALAESLMIDACIIERVAPTATDGAGHLITTRATIYSGKCKVQQPARSSGSRDLNVAEAERYMFRVQLHVPAETPDVLSDDVVTITASTYDTELVGRTFAVRQIVRKSIATAWRLGLEEVTS